jgi:light-regulated signal transduction histidine kinase (bacteriophytochrome)
MVSNFLELLQQQYSEKLDANAHKYINFAVDGATRMKSLILDLLELSRISSVKIPHSKVVLTDVLTQTLDTLKILIDESGAEIKTIQLPVVRGNELQLTQLFQNLINNAIKYKSADAPKIEIGFTEDDYFWQFYIKDNGIGIDKKFFEKIFIIFQRLHNKNVYNGTGIGLAICKKIVELHGGKIWLESKKNNGSTFLFTISKTLVLNN